jgi:hypothetical protein
MRATIAVAFTGALLVAPSPALAQAPCIPALLSPLPDAELDNGRSDQNDRSVWDFDWSTCPTGTLYHIVVEHLGATIPVVDAYVTDSAYHEECDDCYVADENRFNWTWRVRASVNGQWGDWSEIRRFSTEPVNTDPTPVCRIQLNRAAFGDGEAIIAQVARVANPNSSGAVPVEARLSVQVPGGPAVLILSVGQGGTFALPPGFDQDFGPIQLAVVQASYPRGQYQLACRLMHAVTGASLSEHFNPFEIR